MTRESIRPRDIVTPTSLRNALTVALAMGGSTNVALHAVEIARAAGIDLWTEVISQQEFNTLDAQHDATAAFIRSQRGEGWGARHGHYDDGGFADATTERPALEKLLLDVRDVWSTG